MSITIKIKRFDKELPLPTYKTDGAVCMDLYTREDTPIKSKEVGYIPLNIALEVPKNHWSLLVARSSTHKQGIMPVNGVGIIDSDYCGDNDELKFAALNFTDKEVIIEKGSRIAQLMILKNETVQIEEVSHLGNADRSGFGTTGLKDK